MLGAGVHRVDLLALGPEAATGDHGLRTVDRVSAMLGHRVPDHAEAPAALDEETLEGLRHGGGSLPSAWPSEHERDSRVGTDVIITETPAVLQVSPLEQQPLFRGRDAFHVLDLLFHIFRQWC